MIVEEVSGAEGKPPYPGMSYSGRDGGGPNGGGSGSRSSMEDRRAAILPNCLCNPAIAVVRESGCCPEVPSAADVEGCMEIGGCVEGAAEEECGGGLGGTEDDGAAVVLSVESVKATDTKLLCMAD
jgi:hypothetical protein